MADILTSINTRVTPQDQRTREDQVKNTAGGYVFQVGDEARLHRFLTLGTDGNSYYTSAAELTRQNAEVVFRMAANKPIETIQAILDVSLAGRAPKNKQAIFALAICASAELASTRKGALAALPQVCRTGTHLFEFNTYVEQFRGRGRALNRAIGKFYKDKPVDKLAYQVTKYRARNDWTHRDLLRLVKDKAGKSGQISPDRDGLLSWVARGETTGLGHESLAIIQDYVEAKRVENDTNPIGSWVNIINRGHGLSWEMLPDAALKHPAVWEALIAQGIPQTALMRQLPRLTNVFGHRGNWATAVATQLQDGERFKRGRVHPVNVLIAQRTYAQGHGQRGKLSWTPNRQIVDALDAAFHAAYGAVEPTGKRRLIALDVSGSMTVSISGLPISCREAAAALALVTLSTEPETEIVGFTSGSFLRQFQGYSWNTGRQVFYSGGRMVEDNRDPISRLDISARRRLDDVVSYVSGLPFGATDCALPLTWAKENKLDFDSVEILTDNETWSGPIHVHQALDAYRNQVGHDVKLVAVGMTATDYSIVPNDDPSGLNVSGFDSAVPTLISDFVADRL